MAMQQSSKGASGSAPNPALSDEQADQFAASFTPAWDADDGLGDTTNGTADATLANPLMDAAPVALALPGTPAVMRPPASSAEAIEPENVLEIHAAPPAQAAPQPPAQAAQAAPPPATPQMRMGMGTQMMQGRPVQAPAAQAPVVRPAPAPHVAAAADPFRTRAPSATDDVDIVPKRSSKTLIFVVAGLAVAAGLGLFLKFALSSDAPKTAAPQLVAGPAATTAEIPPPPPKVESAPAATTAAISAAKTPEVAPQPLAIPPVAARTEPVPPRLATGPAAPRGEPRQPTRGAALPPPQATAVAPPPAPGSPKTPPKAPNGGIVRDNPF